MILSEASEKYSVPLDRLCRMVSEAGTTPTGERQGKRKMLAEYDEKQLVDAIIADYKRCFHRDHKKADEWKIRAGKVQTIYRKSLPIVDTDD